MNALLVTLHVLGATVWTGGHLILAIGLLPAALRARDPAIILDFESRYERIGILALVVQVATGVLLALPYLPDPDAGTTISAHVAGSLGAKLVLLVLTLGLAVHARLRLIPRLEPAGLKVFAVHAVATTIVSVLFVVIGVAIRLAPAG